MAFGAIFLTAIAGSIAFDNYQFATQAYEVDAAFISTELIDRRRNDTTKITYQFMDSDLQKSRQESDEHHFSYKPKFSANSDGLRLVKIQYIPGQPGESRLSGNANQYYVIVFALMVVFILWCMYRVKRKARAV